MKNILRNLLVLFPAASTPALAAGGSEANGIGLLVILFLAFCAVIVVFQAIPGLVLFFSMLRGLFSTSSRKAASLLGDKDKGRG